MPVRGLIEGSSYLLMLVVAALIAIAAFYAGRSSHQPPVPKVDTVFVSRPADFDRQPPRPRTVVVFDTTEVTVTDTVTVRVPEQLMTSGLQVVGDGAVQIDRPIFGQPQVRFLRFDTEQQRGVEEIFDVPQPLVRFSAYGGIHRNIAPQPEFGVHAGAQVRIGRFAGFGEAASDPRITVGLRYYLTRN